MQAIRPISLVLTTAVLSISLTIPVVAQSVPWNPLKRGSDNMEAVSYTHLTLPTILRV